MPCPNAKSHACAVLSSNEIIRAPQRKSKHQRRQNPSPSLISRRNRIRENMRYILRATTGIRTSVWIANTLSASVARVRRFQIADPEHIHSDRRKRAHLLSDAVRAVPLRLCPFHAACVSVCSAAALAGCADAASFEVGPDLVGEFGDELGGDAEPANGIAFEGEAVGVAVSDGFAGLFDDDVVFGEEFGEYAGDETF
jgi:hypothetical protein